MKSKLAPVWLFLKKTYLAGRYRYAFKLISWGLKCILRGRR